MDIQYQLTRRQTYGYDAAGGGSSCGKAYEHGSGLSDRFLAYPHACL